MKNINTKSYWDTRFSSGDWENKKGRNQTRQFALSQIPYLNIPEIFSGTILDFGCGLGDAFPIYKDAFPNATLMGLDISEEAIRKCKESYGNYAEFMSGTFTDVPKVDIIISSNVFEHLTDDISIAKYLISKCQQLIIIVPYMEQIATESEHINSYQIDYFQPIGNYQFKVFASKGWSQFGLKLLYQVYLKNILRLLFRKPTIKRAKQILFNFYSTN